MVKKDIRYLTRLALMMAVIVVLASTPLGLIDLPVIKATTIHIPVILGAILLGPMAGAVLGGTMGICSLVKNTMAPGLSSFVFSPFLSTTGLPGALKAVWISVGCRILIGLIAGWIWIFLKKVKCKDLFALPVVGFIGSMTNTIAVMTSIYFLFAEQYSAAQSVPLDTLATFVVGIVGTNGVPEAIAAMLLVLFIGKALLAVSSSMQRE